MNYKKTNKFLKEMFQSLNDNSKPNMKKLSESDQKSAKKVKSIIDDVSEFVSGKSSSISVNEIMDYDQNDITAMINKLSDASDDLNKLLKSFK